MAMLRLCVEIDLALEAESTAQHVFTCDSTEKRKKLPDMYRKDNS